MLLSMCQDLDPETINKPGYGISSCKIVNLCMSTSSLIHLGRKISVGEIHLKDPMLNSSSDKVDFLWLWVKNRVCKGSQNCS